MSDHFSESPNLLLDFANLTLRYRRASGNSSNLVGGKLFSGMITTLFRGYPEQCLHTTQHTPLQKQTLLRRGLGFRGVGETLSRTAGIFVFDVWKMLRSSSGCLNFLGSTCVLHGIYCVFVLSDQLWFGSFFLAEFATPAAVAVLGLEPLQLHRL